MSDIEKKFHEHDCDCCHYLGSEIKNKDELDYYVCHQGGGMSTVIARFGEDGDYYSGLYSVKELARVYMEKNPSKDLNMAQAVLKIRESGKIEFSEQLVEAAARAIENGFLDGNLRFVNPENSIERDKKTKLRM